MPALKEVRAISTTYWLVLTLVIERPSYGYEIAERDTRRIGLFLMPKGTLSEYVCPRKRRLDDAFQGRRRSAPRGVLLPRLDDGHLRPLTRLSPAHLARARVEAVINANSGDPGARVRTAASSSSISGGDPADELGGAAAEMCRLVDQRARGSSSCSDGKDVW